MEKQQCYDHDNATVRWTGNGKKNLYNGNNVKNGFYETLISPKSVTRLVKAGIIRRIGKLLYEPTDLDLWFFFEVNAKSLAKMGRWSVRQSHQNSILYFQDEWNRESVTKARENFGDDGTDWGFQNLEFLIRVAKKLQQRGK